MGKSHQLALTSTCIIVNVSNQQNKKFYSEQHFSWGENLKKSTEANILYIVTKSILSVK